jgi:hypothetical protein
MTLKPTQDPEFIRLIMWICHDYISDREIKYLVWRFYCKKTNCQIAELDERKVTRQAITKVFIRAYKKVRVTIQK